MFDVQEDRCALQYDGAVEWGWGNRDLAGNFGASFSTWFDAFWGWDIGFVKAGDLLGGDVGQDERAA